MKNISKVLLSGGGVVALLLIINVVFAEALPQLEVPGHLKLKAPKNRILGSEEKDGVIKYAYRSDVRVSEELSSEVAAQARKHGLDLQGEIVEKRTKHSRTFATDKPGEYIAEIIPGVPQYYKDDDGNWWQAEYATTTKQAFDQQVTARTIGDKIVAFFLPSTHADTRTFYPDENPETNTVDGLVAVTGANTGNMSTLQGTAANQVYDDLTDASMVAVDASGTTNQYAVLRRSIFLFDTSIIGSSATIVAATFSVKPISFNNSLSGNASDNSRIHVVSSNPASNTSLSTSDFTTLGTTDFGQSNTQNNLVAETYEDIVLNSAGKANINKTGISKFGVISGWDLNPNTNFSGLTWGSTNQQGIAIYFADSPGTSKDPKLVVVYNPASLSAYKAVGESRTNSTTLFEDSVLALNLSTSTTYEIEGAIFAVASSTAPDLNIAFAVPSGAIMNISYITGQAQNSEGELLRTSGATSTRIILGTTPKVIHIKGTVRMGTTAGATTFQWAQNSASSNATSILEGSYLKANTLQ